MEKLQKPIDDNRFYDLNAIKEAIDTIVKDKIIHIDVSTEVIKTLKNGFEHIHFPLYIAGTCEHEHEDKECEVENETD